jgi:hypothetical protein
MMNVRTMACTFVSPLPLPCLHARAMAGSAHRLLWKAYRQGALICAWLQALDRYQKLSALLRGEYPAGLLPPSPPGYIAERIRELAGRTLTMHQCPLLVGTLCPSLDLPLH